MVPWVRVETQVGFSLAMQTTSPTSSSHVRGQLGRRPTTKSPLARHQCSAPEKWRVGRDDRAQLRQHLHQAKHIRSPSEVVLAFIAPISAAKLSLILTGGCLLGIEPAKRSFAELPFSLAAFGNHAQCVQSARRRHSRSCPKADARRLHPSSRRYGVDGGALRPCTHIPCKPMPNECVARRDSRLTLLGSLAGPFDWTQTSGSL